VLNFTRGYIARHGYPPTLREIADGTGLASPSAVAYVLDGLEKRGLLRRAHGRGTARTIVLTAPRVEEQWLT
jgi:repressor LexA